MEKFTAAEMQQVIGDASRPAASDAGYTEAEVLTAAREVGLDERAVQASLRAVVTAREAREAQRAARAAWWSQLPARAARVCGALCVAFALATVGYLSAVSLKGSALRAAAERVEAQRARVHSVLARQAQTNAQWQGRSDSSERNAELSGALNRVGVETRRYDGCAREYNESVGSWLGRRASEREGLPPHVPYSSEVRSW